jgi:hypothetical protein
MENYLLSEVKNLFCKVIFFPPKSFLLRKMTLFQNSKKKRLAGRKLTLQSK